MKKKYRSAVIGCGRIGSTFDQDLKRKITSSHCGAYKKHPKTKLYAISDYKKEKLNDAKNFWNIKKAYLNYKDMLAENDIEIVSICTLADTHYQIIKDCVSYGVKAVFCEKPIANNLNDANEIIKLCKKNKILLAINHFRRNDSFFIKLKEDISRMFFGEIQHVNFYYTRGIANSGTHLFDLLRYLFGEVKFINSYKMINDFGHDPTISALLEFENNLTCNIIGLNGDNFRVFDIEIFGTKKVIKIDSAKNIRLFESRSSLRSSEFNELFKIENNYNNTFNSQYFINTIDNIIQAIEKDNYHHINCSGEDGLKSLELILGSIISFEKKIKLISPFKLPISKKIFSI